MSNLGVAGCVADKDIGDMLLREKYWDIFVFIVRSQSFVVEIRYREGYSQVLTLFDKQNLDKIKSHEGISTFRIIHANIHVKMADLVLDNEIDRYDQEGKDAILVSDQILEG